MLPRPSFLYLLAKFSRPPGCSSQPFSYSPICDLATKWCTYGAGLRNWHWPSSSLRTASAWPFVPTDAPLCTASGCLFSPQHARAITVDQGARRGANLVAEFLHVGAQIRGYTPTGPTSRLRWRSR